MSNNPETPETPEIPEYDDINIVDVFKDNPTYLHNRWNQRITHTLECLGPSEPHGSVKYLDYYWKGEVLGDYDEDGYVRNQYIELRHGDMVMIFDSFKSNERRRYFSISLDLNSLELITFENDQGESFYYFFNNNTESYELKQLPQGSYSPVQGLNYYGEADILRTENGVYYLRDNRIHYRIQSERYNTEYRLNEHIRDGSRIRSCGFTRDWRFGIRFYEHV